MTWPGRRRFLRGSLTLAGLGLLAGCGFMPQAQQTKRIPRVGYLGLAPTHNDEGFREGLRELGYVEGQNVAIEWRWAEGGAERLPEVADELLRLDLDLLVARTTQAAVAAKRATTTLPVVFSTVTDPVGSGLVASLARPGGNLTGVSNSLPGLHAKRLQLLQEAVPTASRVAVLGDFDNPGVAIVWTETEAAGQKLGVHLQVLHARGPDDFDGPFAAMEQDGAEALVVLPSATVYLNHRQRIVERAARARLPSMYEAREWAEAGGLLAYGVDLYAVSRRAATYVDKVLKGARPAELPVEQPTTFEFVVNLKTARAIGLTIPRSLLVQATEVIQ